MFIIHFLLIVFMAHNTAKYLKISGVDVAVRTACPCPGMFPGKYWKKPIVVFKTGWLPGRGCMALFAVGSNLQNEMNRIQIVVEFGLMAAVTFRIQKSKFVFNLADMASLTIQTQMSAG